MIILRQKTYATAASFKPKFRKRFRNGDFSYVQAKNPAHEALNHQAYKEVAAEDEFKNNPETYKIRQGLFSEVSQEDKKKLGKLANAACITGNTSAGTLIGITTIKSIKNKSLTPPHLATTLGLGSLGVGNYALYKSQVKKLYKKYHPEAKNPTNKEIEDWVIKEAKAPYDKTLLDDIIQKKEGKK